MKKGLGDLTTNIETILAIIDSIVNVSRLFVSAITPLVIVVIGFFLNKRLKKLEQVQWANQKLTEKRIEYYYSAVPELNDIMCFFSYIGNWKEISPRQIIQKKRELDKGFYLNAPLFPMHIHKLYFQFIHMCYDTFQGWGKEPKLKTSYERRKEALGESWKSHWETAFSAPSSQEEPREIQKAYNELVSALAETLEFSEAQLPRSSVPHSRHVAKTKES